MKLTYVVAVVAALLVIGSANAGVVTLVGTCVDHPMQNGTILFMLNNTGNDTANNLFLTPHIIGAQLENYTYSIAAITPGGNASLYVPINESNMHGSYILYFDAVYQQGLSIFTAVFPCIISVGQGTVAPVFITTTGSVSNNVANLKVNVSNYFGEKLRINVSAIIPPSFKYISSRYQIVNVSPYNYSQVNFAVQAPALAGASYTGAIAATYKLNGVEFSTMSVVRIFKAASQYNLLGIATWASIAVAVAIIALLILRSYLKRRKRKDGTEETKAQ
ncbi:MAG: hypothetical protein ACP5K9_02105 [Candidatus Micrarchaeia archaeon]